MFMQKPAVLARLYHIPKVAILCNTNCSFIYHAECVCLCSMHGVNNSETRIVLVVIDHL